MNIVIVSEISTSYNVKIPKLFVILLLNKIKDISWQILIKQYGNTTNTQTESGSWLHYYIAYFVDYWKWHYYKKILGMYK